MGERGAPQKLSSSKTGRNRIQDFRDDKGEIAHDIDTVVMLPGVYELWVDDLKAKTASNVARFEVTMNSKDLEK